MKKLEQRLYPILDEHNITVPFPPKAAEQALALPAEVAEKDLRGRRNLTDQLIITIDGDDAKDFDDAVQVTKTADSGYRLGVHIADVSHYVTEGSPLDQAAFDRGTSVYLIDSVVPMLPEELSNELCSLKPHVIRLTLSVFMDFDSKGELLRYEIAESYIRSCHRMTYGDVTEMLEGK